MFTPKFQEENTTALISDETRNVTTVAESTTVLYDKTESESIMSEGSEGLNSTVSDAVNSTAETLSTNSDGNVNAMQETINPTSFGGWSTLSSSSSSNVVK